MHLQYLQYHQLSSLVNRRTYVLRSKVQSALFRQYAHSSLTLIFVSSKAHNLSSSPPLIPVIPSRVLPHFTIILMIPNLRLSFNIISSMHSFFPLQIGTFRARCIIQG
jgi:hypothetical protein